MAEKKVEYSASERIVVEDGALALEAARREVEELRARLAEVQQQAGREDAPRLELPAGWLIEARVGYDGVTAGVQFRNGRAVLPSGSKDAHKIMLRLLGDFGYRVTPLDEAQFQREVQAVAHGAMLPGADGRPMAQKLVGGPGILGK